LVLHASSAFQKKGSLAGDCKECEISNPSDSPNADEAAIRVSLPGGDLLIEWRQHIDGHVIMTGPVEFEHEGKFESSIFEDMPVQ
jgi:hypothetical protein